MGPTTRALIRVMTAGRADDAANHRELVHHGGDLWKHFADLQTGNRCRDGVEFAANFLGRFGLDIPHVLMRGAAAKENVDYRFWSRGNACFGVGSKDIGQRQAAQADSKRADFQETSPGHAVAEAFALSING